MVCDMAHCVRTSSGQCMPKHNNNTTNHTTPAPAPTPSGNHSSGGNHSGWTPSNVQGYWCHFLNASVCMQAPFCAYHQNRRMCLPKPCGLLNGDLCTRNKGCWKNPTNGQCQAKPCGQWNANKTACNEHPRCNYND